MPTPRRLSLPILAAALYAGVCAAAFVADVPVASAHAAQLPPAAATSVVLVKDVNDTMKGVPPTKTPAFPPLAKKPSTVRGWVKDGAGRPIAGARVAVYSSAAGGYRTTHTGRSNAQGLYEVLLPMGVGEVAEGTCRVTYNGAQYDLPLSPVAGEFHTFDIKSGHVENFVLRTEGEYGGTLRVLDNVDRGTLELTLTPAGRLLDGTPGRTFVYRYPAGDVSGETFLNGLPLGRYTLKARLLDDGDTLPMRAGRTFDFDDEALKSSLQVDFQPGYTFSQANPGKSNKAVAYFQVTLKP